MTSVVYTSIYYNSRFVLLDSSVVDKYKALIINNDEKYVNSSFV